MVSFLGDADKHAPLEVCVFNIGANVNFPIVDTTERVFRKVWEMACYSGFLAGREAARLMLPRGKGNIFFTGATAQHARRTGFCGVCQREIRIARGGAVDRTRARSQEHPCRPSRDRFQRRHRMGAPADCQPRRGQAIENLDPNRLMRPAAVAEAYWQLYQQPRDAWTFEHEIRPFGEKW